MKKQINLEKNLYKYLLSQLEDDNLKSAVSEKSKEQDEVVAFYLDVDTKIDLMDYVEDLQLQVGFVNEDYLNDDGEKLQRIYDQIYAQTN